MISNSDLEKAWFVTLQRSPGNSSRKPPLYRMVL